MFTDLEASEEISATNLRALGAPSPPADYLSPSETNGVPRLSFPETVRHPETNTLPLSSELLVEVSPPLGF